MISIKILGPGCSKCKALERKINDIVEKNNINAEIIKLETENDFIHYGIMMTPALVINEEVKSVGKIPTDDKIIEWLNN